MVGVGEKEMRSEFDEVGKLEAGGKLLGESKVLKDLWVKWIDGSDKVKKVLEVQLFNIAREKPELINEVLESFYDVVGLKGAFRNKNFDRASGRDLQKLFTILERHPIGALVSSENSIASVLYDVGLIKSVDDLKKPDIQALLKDYSEWKKNKKRWEELSLYSSLGAGASLIFDLISKNPKTKLIAKSIGLVSGITNLAGNLREMPNSYYHFEQVKNAQKLLEMTLSSFAVLNAFRRVPNPFFKTETLKELIDNESYWGLVKGRIDRLKEFDFSSLLNKPVSPLDYLKLDVELPSSDVFLSALQEFRDIFSRVRGSLSKDLIKDLIAKGGKIDELKPAHKEAIENISRITTLRSLANMEVLKTAGKQEFRVFTESETQEKLIAKFDRFDEVFKFWEENKNNFDNLVVKYVNIDEKGKEVVLRTLPLQKTYLPLFARNFIVKYEEGGILKTGIYDEFDFLEGGILDEIVANGGKIHKVIGANVDIFASRRFSNRVLQEVEKSLQKVESTDDILRELHSNLKSLIAEMKEKKYVWGLERTQDLGFLEKLAKKEYRDLTEDEVLELARAFLLRNIASKIFPREIFYIKNTIESLAKAGREGTLVHITKDIIDKIEKPLDIPGITAFNNFFRRMFLLANVPVRFVNTISTLFIPFHRLLGRTDISLREKFSIIQLMLRDFFSSAKLPSFKELREMDVLSPVEVLTIGIKAPFEEIIDDMLERWGKSQYKGVSLLRYAFPELGSAEEVRSVIKSLWFSEIGAGRPLFLYTKAGQLVGELSAFFTPNYIPFYLTFKSWAEPFAKLFISRDESKAKILSSLMGVGMAGTFYSILMGASNYPIIDFIDKSINSFKVFWEIAFGDKEGLGILKEAGGDISPSMYMFSQLVSELGFARGIGSGLEALITNILMGGGLVGYLTELRTKGGALTLPELFDAPVIQIATDFLRRYDEYKKRLAEDPRNSAIYLKAILDTAGRNAGLITRVRNNFFDTFSQYMYEPRQKFVDGMRQLFFPREFFVFEPLPARIYDKKTISAMRAGGVESLSYLLGSLKRGEEKGGKPYLVMRNIAKNLQAILDKKEIDAEDKKNFIYLMLLGKLVAGATDLQLTERERETISKKLNVDMQAILEYEREVANKMKIARALVEKRR